MPLIAFSCLYHSGFNVSLVEIKLFTLQARDGFFNNMIKREHQCGDDWIKEDNLGDANFQMAFDNLFKCPRNRI